MNAALHIRCAGAGPDLALIHGWGLSARVWEPLVEPLAAHFRVHVVDLPGYGDSANPHGEWNVASLAAIADATMAALPERVTLCGWSLGAHVAVSALARHASRVERLALCAATPCFVHKADWPHGVAPSLLTGFASMLRLSPQTVVGRFATMINQNDQGGRTLARLAAQMAAGDLPDEDALQGGLRVLGEFDWRPLQAKIPRPVLLVHGDLDPLMPLAGAQAMERAIPGARLEVFSGSAHTPFLSQPARFVDLLRDFAAAGG